MNQKLLVMRSTTELRRLVLLFDDKKLFKYYLYVREQRIARHTFRRGEDLE